MYVIMICTHILVSLFLSLPANQETIAELINFFKRAVPDHAFAGLESDDSKPTASGDLQQKGV